MTALQWDQVGDRRYESGVDRGILFLLDGTAIPWNGLTGFDESTSQDVESFYVDGVKFFERHTPGDFAGTLKAYTYPEEFEELLGVKTAHPGFRLHDQQPKAFNLCYRTKIGNDVDGDDHGYKIHILYNVFAVPDTRSFKSITNAPDANEFSWQLSGAPPAGAQGWRPTTHISIDSTQVWAPQLQDLENLLYGTSTTDPVLLSQIDLTDYFLSVGELLIVDNGDGTWTAYDSGDNYIVDDGDADPTTFKIENANVSYIDADTYTLQTTRGD